MPFTIIRFSPTGSAPTFASDSAIVDAALNISELSVEGEDSAGKASKR